MNDLTPEELRRALFAALKQAFPTIARLRPMVTVAYGFNYDGVVGEGADLPGALTELILHAEAQELVPQLLAAARSENPTHRGLRKLADESGQGLLRNAQDETIVIEKAGFQQPEEWRDLMSRRELAVFRIEIDGGAAGPAGIGTGFLVGPNAGLSCDHVFERNGIHALEFNRSRVRLRFDYKADADGSTLRDGVTFGLQEGADWCCRRSPQGQLDYVLFRIDGTPGSDPVGTPGTPARGWIDARPQPLATNEPLLLLHHPDARRLEMTLGAALEVQARRIGHNANTQPGSSGAPCFDSKWRLAAIHQKGVGAGGNNGAVPMPAILEDLVAGPCAALLAPAPPERRGIHAL
ncbi:effector-associated domain EAD1-containing protein [Variovorax sp. JS1663]|uniref:effector-associated domain EAD1-containing protein n=1 Tax=Variovorax sp. JS1663 TaxID=1851577 RepID=UPI000B66539A|nr:effector-associated domain EAD1-containing protein [Variovorax sp. JS1663]OUM04085.1 hypothetical protein A8M77_03485 [Variovorax sp. JS1663]